MSAQSPSKLKRRGSPHQPTNMASSNNMNGKTVFVTGGSGGLGKAIGKLLASRGAHVTIFGRREHVLEDARKEICEARLHESQNINAVALDLSDHARVDAQFRAQIQAPDVLYCAAGGNHAENGFLVDITSSQIESCMKNNYYATAYAIKTVVDMWTEADREAVQTPAPSPKLRQVVIISSAAAFVSLPGSIAYTPAKVAVRALADTLRLEFLRYSCPSSTYSVHCAFPGDFVSPGFYLEQHTKTPLTKRMQGTNITKEKLEAKYPSSDEVASLVVTAVDKGEFIICSDSMAASALFTNMIGPSPKRGLGILDSVMSLLVGWFVWPIIRRRWEAMCQEDGNKWRSGGT
ncbi:putative short chain dehydrogenase/ reductase [Nemania sp. FL0031]|nr:putative short chain dehydrogenase/ reductase [Nemania sp. FL0031]